MCAPICVQALALSEDRRTQYLAMTYADDDRNVNPTRMQPEPDEMIFRRALGLFSRDDVRLERLKILPRQPPSSFQLPQLLSPWHDTEQERGLIERLPHTPSSLRRRQTI
jgi:hypothetical protein